MASASRHFYDKWPQKPKLQLQQMNSMLKITRWLFVWAIVLVPGCALTPSGMAPGWEHRGKLGYFLKEHQHLLMLNLCAHRGVAGTERSLGSFPIQIIL